MAKNEMGKPLLLSHSQNFLENSQLAADLIRRTDIDSRDLVVEIGPGKGVITRELAKQARHVLAVEIDKTLVETLRGSLHKDKNVTVIETDFLQWSLPTKPYKVFSNIPFNLTTSIVTKLLMNRNVPKSAYLIMQDKAAERFIGVPFGPNTQISVLLKPWFETDIIARIDRRQFTPIPAVDAVLAMFRSRKVPLVDDQHLQGFRDFVVYGFNQWKPTVLEAFREIFSPKQRTIIGQDLGIIDAKPSDLDFEQWLSLFSTFSRRVPDYKKRLVQGAEERLKNQQQKLKKLRRTR